jgi:hypothetical protein
VERGDQSGEHKAIGLRGAWIVRGWRKGCPLYHIVFISISASARYLPALLPIDQNSKC